MLVKKVFQGRETMRVVDIVVEGRSDINNPHGGVGGKRHGERPNDLKEMIGVIGGEGFDNGLEVGVDLH